MSTAAQAATERVPLYAGLRMSADEYFELEDDGFKYELVNGVVVVSPSPLPRHQKVALVIASQLLEFVERRRLGEVFHELDAKLDGEHVYRPEIIFVRAERVRRNWDRIKEPPDLAVEVISPGSRRYDSETKKRDYERFGVLEYWLIDPDRDTMTFYRLVNGAYVEIPPRGDRFASEAVPGFTLDLERVRRAFRPW